MTRNNLKDHLPWLLKNPPQNAPNAPVLPPPPPPTTDFSPPEPVLAPAPAAASFPATSRDMGKLVSASASKSTRPSLILRQEQLLTPTSTTASASTSRAGPLQREYSALVRGSSLASSSKKPGRPPLHTPGPTIPEDLDTVDLSGDVGNDSSLHFGDPVTLWTEQHATRPSPARSPRGKKRKSQSPAPRPALDTDDEFPDIDDILSAEELLHSRVKKSSSSPAKSRLKLKAAVERTPSKTARPAIDSDEEEAMQWAAAHSPTRRSPAKQRLKLSPSKSARRPSASPPPRSRKDAIISSDDDLMSEVPDSPPLQPQKTPRSRTARPSTHVIQDSDDDDIMVSPVPLTYSKRAQSPKSSQVVIRNSPAKSGAIKSPSSPPCTKIAAPKSTIPPSSSSRQTAFNLSQDVAPKNSSTPEMLSQIPSLSSLPEVTLDEDGRADFFEQFLKSPDVIQHRESILEEMLAKNKGAYMLSLRNRNVEARERLKRQKEQILQQKTALEALSGEFRSFTDYTGKREALINRMGDAYETGLDAQADEDRLTELDAEYERRADALVKCLMQAGIDDNFLSEFCNLTEKTAALQQPIVQATQQQPEADKASYVRRPSASQGGPGQVIHQTQIQQSNGGFSRSPARKQNSDYQQFSHGADVSFPPPRSTFRQTPPGPTEPSTDPYGCSDEDDVFNNLAPRSARQQPAKYTSSSVRPGQQPGRSDAYPRIDTPHESDYSGDDLDITELDHHPPSHRSISERNSSKSLRSVLSETTGNVAPPKQQAVKRVSSQTARPHFPPEQMKFAWSPDVRRALKDRFRMSGFRHNQLEAINTTLAGKDAFILMPTGGGKSLCYQLPAVITSGSTSGITIVVSPLLSLMQDQVDHLKALNIQAVSFNGDTNAQARHQLLQTLKIESPETFIQLLYVTPEMVNKSRAFLDGMTALYNNGKLARLVIDEAHCVSQWGHDFRPDYKELGAFRCQFPGIPVMALTATATQNVIVDIKHNLGIDKCNEFSQSFNRLNLYYEIQRKERGNVDTIASLINNKYAGQTGIVYTLSRKSAETIAEKLRNSGIEASHYHASIESEEKAKVQRLWQQGKTKVVVATIAFGMGIDKPDVRFVVHQSVPKSLEGYYQETGRAGRDGKPSDCILYFGIRDVTQLRKMIEDGDGGHDQKERQKNMLNTVASFCDDQSECRRVAILRYFGEAFDKKSCGQTCDNCKAGDNFETKDYTEYAVGVLETIRSRKRLTINQCTEILMGRKKKGEDRESEHTFGMAKGLPKHEINRIIDRLATEEALREDNVVNNRVGIAVQYFLLGRYAHSFLTGQRQLHLTTRVKDTSEQTKAAKTKRAAKPAAPATKRNPPSTNVSSPVRATGRKSKGKATAGQVFEESDDGLDNFIVDDNDEDFDLEGDPFQTMQVRKPLRQRTLDNMGTPAVPPIAPGAFIDEAEMTDMQRDVISEFVDEAAKLQQELINSKGLRQQWFTRQHFRDMATRGATSLDHMQTVPGIDPAKVKKYGVKFLPLLQGVQEMLGSMAPKAAAAASTGLGGLDSHDFVDLISSDEDDIYGDLANNGSDGETSGYFGSAAPQPQQGSANVQEWHKNFERLSEQKSTEGSRGKASSRSRGSSRGGGKRAFGRKNSGSYAKAGKSNAGVRKRTSGGARKSGGSTASASAANSFFDGSGSGGSASFGGRKGRGGYSGGAASGGIGLMRH